MCAYVIEFASITLEADTQDEATDQVMSNLIGGWFPEIFTVRRRLTEPGPSKKMLWAIHCITGVDTRKSDLTFDQASELIGMSKRNGGKATKIQIKERYLDMEREARL